MAHIFNYPSQNCLLQVAQVLTHVRVYAWFAPLTYWPALLEANAGWNSLDLPRPLPVALYPPILLAFNGELFPSLDSFNSIVTMSPPKGQSSTDPSSCSGCSQGGPGGRLVSGEFLLPQKLDDRWDLTGTPSGVFNGKLVVIELEEFEILSPWLPCLLLHNSFLLGGLSCWNSQLLRVGLTDLEILFDPITSEIWRLGLLLLLLRWRWLDEHSHTAFLGRRRGALEPEAFADTLALGFFLFFFAGPWGLLFIWGFRLVVGDVFFGSVGVVKGLLVLKWESLPFLDDLGDKFGLPHPGELMPVLVVLLSGKLPIEFGQLLSLKFALHKVFE